MTEICILRFHFQLKANRPLANRCMDYIVNKFEHVGRGSPSEQIWTGLYVVTRGPLPPVIRHSYVINSSGGWRIRGEASNSEGTATYFFGHIFEKLHDIKNNFARGLAYAFRHQNKVGNGLPPLHQLFT